VVQNAGMVSPQPPVSVRRTVERVSDGWHETTPGSAVARAEARWFVVEDGADVLDALGDVQTVLLGSVEHGSAVVRRAWHPGWSG
jgi:hypothetical protein